MSLARRRLPTLLAHLPADGLHAKVFQARWAAKGLPVPTSSPATLASACYWDVQKVKLGFRDDGKPHAKAFGVLYWKGKRVTPEDKLERIKGGLKYKWAASSMPPALVKSPRSQVPSEEPEA